MTCPPRRPPRQNTIICVAGRNPGNSRRGLSPPSTARTTGPRDVEGVEGAQPGLPLPARAGGDSRKVPCAGFGTEGRGARHRRATRALGPSRGQSRGEGSPGPILADLDATKILATEIRFVSPLWIATASINGCQSCARGRKAGGTAAGLGEHALPHGGGTHELSISSGQGGADDVGISAADRGGSRRAKADR